MAEKQKNNKTNTGAVKALNITAIALTAISILISIVALIYLCVAIYAAQTTEAISQIANNVQSTDQTYINGEDLVIGQSQTNIMSLANLGFGFMLAFTILSLLAAGFSMFVSIFTIARVNKKDYPKVLFTLHLVSALTSFLTANFVRLVIIIIASVYVYRLTMPDKKKPKKKKKKPKHQSPN